jgi:hypothetical protein
MGRQDRIESVLCSQWRYLRQIFTTRKTNLSELPQGADVQSLASVTHLQTRMLLGEET